MTLIGVPCINRPDLLLRFLDSIDEPWPVLVIDNSPDGSVADAVVASRHDVAITVPASNLGVAGSWNHIVKSSPALPAWIIANADAELGPGDLGRIMAGLDEVGWCGLDGDWRVFGITADTIERVGFFDENFHPIYCEDADYEYRCRLAGVPWGFVQSGRSSHEGSAAIRSGYGAANARTYPLNRAYYEAKWGGSLRGGERFRTPFNAAGSVRDWTLDLGRLREQAWHTA